MLGGVTVEFLERLHRRLRGAGQGRECFDAGAGVGSERRGHPGPGQQVVPSRIDFFTLKRLLRPLVLAGTGGVPTPAAALRLWCHEVSFKYFKKAHGPWSRAALPSSFRVLRNFLVCVFLKWYALRALK